MLLRFTFKEQKEVKGDTVHGLIFSLFPPEIATAVHKKKEKPFSLRGFSFKDGELKLKLSLLEDNLFPPLVGRYYLEKEGFYLSGISLKPILPGGLKEEESISYEELLCLEPQEHYCIDFLTPTTFRHGPWDYPLPHPEMLFTSLYRKWKSFWDFPLSEEELRRSVYKKVYILAHRIRVEKVDFSFGNLRGFVGNVVIGVKDKELSRLLHALLKFGEFSGAGRKSTMGMGVMALRGCS